VLTLRAPGPGDEDVARAAQAVLQAEGFDFGFLAPGERWPDHLAGLERGRLGLDLAPGRVPATFLYADVDGQVVGRASVRHALTDQLLRLGGHIGYAVLPPFRRRGYGTEILRQSLVVARAEGVGRVLVTCDDDNLGSIAVIERCGGRRDVEWPGDDGTRRYWIA
jgi:predicted acetyltransferase